MKNINKLIFKLNFLKAVVLSIFMILFLTMCKNIEEDWAEAKKTNTVEAYASFIEDYPESEFAKEAEDMKSVLEEDEKWNNSLKENSINGYNEYLTAYPEGKYSNEALVKKTELEEDGAWKEASKTKTLASLDEFLKKYPGSKYLKEAASLKAKLIPNINFKSVKKSMLMTSSNVYGIPTTVRNSSGELIGEYLSESSWIVGLNSYFFIVNKGAAGLAAIKVKYYDGLGTARESVKSFNFSSGEYKIKVNVKFKSNVSVGVSYGSSRLNTVKVILPNGKSDQFATRIPSWQGSIESIDIERSK